MNTVQTQHATYPINAGIFDNIEKLKNLGRSAKDKLKHEMKEHISHVSHNLKISKEAVALAYEEPRMANVLQAVGYSTATLYSVFQQASAAAHHGVFSTLTHIVGHEALHEVHHKVGHSQKVTNVDKILDKYPVVKRLSGPAIAGLLLYPGSGAA